MKESSESKNYKTLVGGGYIDDLSKFYLINEDSIIKELRARFKKGKIYVITEIFSFFHQVTE